MSNEINELGESIRERAKYSMVKEKNTDPFNKALREAEAMGLERAAEILDACAQTEYTPKELADGGVLVGMVLKPLASGLRNEARKLRGEE